MSRSRNPRSGGASRARGGTASTGRKRNEHALEFEGKRVELEHFLRELAHTLWKQGAGASSGRARVAREDAAGARDERAVWEDRSAARVLTAAMADALEARLRTFAAASAALSAEERANMAALLALPEQRRRTVGAIMRLPDAERQALATVFVLSEPECRALAEFLRPGVGERKPEPSLTIIDPSVADAADEHGEVAASEQL
jgi:hypothetical protein